MKVRIVRAAKAVGSRDTTIVIPILKMIERGKVVLPSGGSVKMSFTHPKDVAQALLKAATSAGDWTPYLVKSFDVSLGELAKALVRASGKKRRGEAAGGLLGKEPHSAVPGGARSRRADARRGRFLEEASVLAGITISRRS